MSLLDENSRLSDVYDVEQAQEIALKHRPEKMVWECNGGKDSELASMPDWIIKAMIEFRDETTEDVYHSGFRDAQREADREVSKNYMPQISKERKLEDRE